MRKTKLNQKVVCKDGFTMSVQANKGAYCTPRIDNAEAYTTVEVGYPSQYEPLLMPWIDGARPLDTVYGYVPVEEVTTILAKHGGVIGGEVPRGVVRLKALDVNIDHFAKRTLK